MHALRGSCAPVLLSQQQRRGRACCRDKALQQKLVGSHQQHLGVANEGVGPSRLERGWCAPSLLLQEPWTPLQLFDVTLALFTDLNMQPMYSSQSRTHQQALSLARSDHRSNGGLKPGIHVTGVCETGL
jgi:hypothetical protein